MKHAKTIAGLAGVAAGATLLSILLFRKRQDGSTLATDLLGKAKTTGDTLARYGRELKARLLHEVKGPNGEDVYLDMYDRQFYEDPEGKRVYMELTK